MANDAQGLRIQILTFGYILGFTPICWDKWHGALKISRSVSRMGWIKAQILLVLLYQAFLFYQALKPSEAGTSRVRVIYLSVLLDHIGNIWIPEYVDLMMKKLNTYIRKQDNCKRRNNTGSSAGKVLRPGGHSQPTREKMPQKAL